MDMSRNEWIDGRRDDARVVGDGRRGRDAGSVARGRKLLLGCECKVGVRVKVKWECKW